MLKKLFKSGKKGEEESQKTSELAEKIGKMNITEMRSYVNGKAGLELCEEGLDAVVTKLCSYLQESDMDSKKKKAFDLVLLCAQSKHISFNIVEKIQEFVTTYQTLIKNYDKEHKEIYASRFRDALEVAIQNMQEMKDLHAKMSLLGENKANL